MDSLTLVVAALAATALLVRPLFKKAKKSAPKESPCGTGCCGCPVHARCSENDG